MKLIKLIVIFSFLLSPLPAISQDEPTPIPPEITDPPVANEQEPIQEELNEEPAGEENPLLPPDLDELIDKKISEDVWAQLKGDLPCVSATTECINRLQGAALESNPVLKELDLRIEEANTRINDARDNNIKSLNLSTFSPFLQAVIGSNLTPLRTSTTATPVANPLSLIFGNFFANLLGEGLQTVFNWRGLDSTGEAASRQILISDLQIKVAELQRARAQSAEKIKETVAEQLLILEQIAREFQIQQEIAKRDKARLEIITVSYKYGQGDTNTYLRELSSYDRQKAETWRQWSRLRSQLTKMKILVFGTENI